MLDAVDCQHSVVTIDAMGAQKAIVEKIVQKQADYVIALKANQGALYEQVVDFMKKNQTRLPYFESLDKDHGRGEQRRVYVANNIALVDEAEAWKELRSLVITERVRHTGKGINRQLQYYMSSLITTPEQMAQYVRGHWAIENKLHWQLDFTFKEDGSRLRKGNGPANLHLVRKWALHLLKKDTQKISLKRKRKKAARSSRYLMQILTS